MIKCLVFDLGDVVLKPTDAFPDLAARLATPEDRFERAYWAHRREYDLTSDAGSFWTAVAREAGAAPPSSETIAELVRLDDLGWSIADEDTLALARDAHQAGQRLSVLSNAPSSMGRLIAAQPWAAAFAPLLISGDLGLLKPEPEIYLHLLDRLAAPADEVAFLDDRTDNVTGALAVGIRAVHFTGAAQARSDLRALGIAV